MTRAFVALRPAAPVLDAIDAIGARARDVVGRARWTRREQWHLTLQFLGDRVEVERVADALRDLDHPSEELQLGGMGTFPRDRRATVLWLGLARGSEWTAALAGALGTRLAPIGHPPDERPFHPHVTLARFDPARDLREPLGALDAATVGPAWRPAEVVLYASHPHREGARYEALATFPLR